MEQATQVKKKAAKNAPVTPLQAGPRRTIWEIEVARIADCNLLPQVKRSLTFKPDELQTLADSIEQDGLEQPILIRPLKDDDPRKGQGFDFETVFGARRKKAHELKGFEKIDCFIKELTDAEVIKRQYKENHERAQNDALVDAYYFQYLEQNEGYSRDRIADTFGTTKAEVTKKIRLNFLIPEAVQQYVDKHLPLNHAYYLATFPEEAQRKIVKEGYAYRRGDIGEGACLYNEFKEECEIHILRDLGNAPFDTEDTRLHLKGLKCSECSKRTGWEPALYPEIKAGNSCLDPDCFQIKTGTSMRLNRLEIAEPIAVQTNKPVEDAVKDVPLVTERSWTNEKAIPFKEKVLTNQEILPDAECEFSELSLAVDGEKKGQKVYICREANCPVHHPKKDAPADPEDLKKLEENFRHKVARAVRTKILAKALESFDDYSPFWMFDDLIRRLLAEFWFRSGYDVLDSILEICRDWKNLPADKFKPEQVEKFISSLDKSRQSQLLFLFAFSTEGFFKNSTQEGIRQVAKDYTKLDYRKVEAEMIVRLAPLEFTEIAEAYYAQILDGIDADKPSFWIQEVG